MTSSRTLSAIALRHLAFEDLGVFEPPIARAGYEITTLDCGVDSIAAAADADLVIVLGGPIGVYDQDHYPWLGDELDLLRDRLERRLPTLGICLGAQLMAAALGGKVHAGNAGKEIGFFPLVLTPAGEQSPLRHLAPALCLPLHWHGDTFDLPMGATLLASTEKYPNQAFAVGDHALALQFHPEFDARRVEQWLVGHTGELQAAGITPSAIRAEARIHGQALAQQGTVMLDHWLSRLR